MARLGGSLGGLAALSGSLAGLAAWPGLASATAQARALRTEELHPERELARARVDDGIMETHLKKRDCDVSFDGPVLRFERHRRWRRRRRNREIHYM